MEERADTLRRRIALYHAYLQKGIDRPLAIEFVVQILNDEAELHAEQPRISVNREPQHLLAQARYYRGLAAQESNHRRAALLRQLAEAFDANARTSLEEEMAEHSPDVARHNGISVVVGT